MARITATTSNGTEISRNATEGKMYTHAYVVSIENGSIILDKGFCTGETNARKAAVAGFNVQKRASLPDVKYKIVNEDRDLKFEVIPVNPVK